jgi:hypothetical protein
MPQLRGASSLAQEAVPILAGQQAAGTGYLQGDDPVELRVASLVNRPERADTDWLE